MYLHDQAVSISTTGGRERTKQNYSNGTEGHMSKAYIENVSKRTLLLVHVHPVLV